MLLLNVLRNGRQDQVIREISFGVLNTKALLTPSICIYGRIAARLRVFCLNDSLAGLRFETFPSRLLAKWK